MATLGPRESTDEQRGLRDEPRVASPSRSRLRYVIAVAATIILVGFLVRRDGDGFARAVAGADPAWISAAVAMATAAVLLGTLRWQLVVRAMHYPLGFGRALSVVLAAWPLALITPSRAGDFARALGVR